ncbi:MAG: hypothetical protein BLITH_0215 [Brockia lithotrophica]|uniref:Uncharacterized protein n=1 Tax=Brockia lithotrophica TaxID=933949 RepID=A0A2T5GAC3_9BACL|nr:MAG: hypothetical protein BLITH_0215 [Brockia lithotrophica]
MRHARTRGFPADVILVTLYTLPYLPISCPRWKKVVLLRRPFARYA